MDNYLTIEWAKIILEMEAVCVSEGQGPESNEIINYIYKNYPELFEGYSWLIPVV